MRLRAFCALFSVNLPTTHEADHSNSYHNDFADEETEVQKA